MTNPVRVGELLPGVLAEVVDRAGHGYDRWAEQVAATGYCTHPVRLRGRVEHADADTGEIRTVYATDREPDATLLKACGNRRASVCPSCSATYQADSFHLLAAGLRGGKGVPETVNRPSRLFVTFTAPSFGRVHSRKAQGLMVFPCRHPYRQGQRARMAAGLGCWQRHDEDDPRLGEPLCPRLLQTRRRKSCGTPWPGGCGRGPPSMSIGRWPSSPGSTRPGCGGWSGCRSPRWPSTRTSRARSTSTRSFAWTPPPTAAARLPGPAAGRIHGRAARGGSSEGGHGRPGALPGPRRGPGRDADARWGEQLDVRHITRLTTAGSCRLSRWPAMSPSTRPRAPRPWASPRPACR